MSKWNIRILHDTYPDKTEYFFPAEVYYEGDLPTGYGGFNSEGETPEDVRLYAQQVVDDTHKPILHAGERFPQIYDPKHDND